MPNSISIRKDRLVIYSSAIDADITIDLLEDDTIRITSDSPVYANQSHLTDKDEALHRIKYIAKFLQISEPDEAKIKAFIEHGAGNES